MPSRISGACTPCRSKKQKCSGHHPSCSQCQNASIECTWPEQRKRGPAKDYIKALESRLHEAESLLLAILPLINDNIIDRASNTLGLSDEDNIEGLNVQKSSPPSLNKKTGLDYWDQFPIDTRKNIRKWQYDCEAQNGHSGVSNYISLGSTVLGKRNRARTHSPNVPSLNSPRGSSPAIPSQHTSWMQSMPTYVSAPIQHQMQTGAAQLLDMSNHQRRNHWITQSRQHTHSHHYDTTRLDPDLMQPRSMPQETPHIYAGNMQQNLFW